MSNNAERCRLRWLLVVPLVLLALVGVELVPLLAGLAIARAPLDVYPQMVMDFVRSTVGPIVGNEVYLGMAIRGMPDVHAVHRNRREALLERFSLKRPMDSIIAVVVLDRFYSPEEMSRLIDPQEWNVVGFGALAPSLGPHGLASGGGLMRTAVNIEDIPPGPFPERAVQRWEDLRARWDDWIKYDAWMLNSRRDWLNIIRAGKIPETGFVVYHNGHQLFLHADSGILNMTPQDRLKNQYWQYGLAQEEKAFQQAEQAFEDLRDRLHIDKGIYAVVIEGSAAKVNTLRQRPEVVIVDPLLFDGPFGVITTGRNNPRLRVMFLPTRPNEIVEAR